MSGPMVLQTEQSALLMFVGEISYGWFDSEKQFRRGTLSPRTVSVVLEVDKLITPLRDDSQGVFEKGDNDEEPPNGWEISAIEYFVNAIFFLFAASFCLHLLHIVHAPISAFLERALTASVDQRWYPTNPQSCSSVHVSGPVDLDHW